MTGLALDHSLPQRDLLLDAVAMQQRFSTRLSFAGIDKPLSIDRCAYTRAKYRIGESLRVLYELYIGGTRHTVTARTFRNGTAAQTFLQAQRNATACGPLQAVVYDQEIDTVFWTFPNDRKIPHLATLVQSRGPLAHALGQRCKSIRVVAYAPERALTAQCLDENGETIAYAKAYAGEEGKESYTIHDRLYQQLIGNPPLRVPRPLDYLDEFKILLLEPIHGNHAADLQGDSLIRAAHSLGQALASFHRLNPPPVPPFYHLDLSSLATAVRLLKEVRPDVGTAASRVLERLQQNAVADPGPSVCLHGDVNFKNWMATSNGVALIDLDAVSTGPAAADIGGLLSGFTYRRIIGRYSAELEQTLQKQFLSGYGSMGLLPNTEIVAWHTAAALLGQRVFRAVTRLRGEALPYLGPLLAEANALLT